MNMRISIIATGVVFALLTLSGCTATRDPKPATSSVDDRVITSTIKALYAQSKKVTNTNISVETLYGIVLLSGTAKSLEEKIAATSIAEQVDGVKAVHDEILIHSNTARGTASGNSTPPALSL